MTRPRGSKPASAGGSHTLALVFLISVVGTVLVSWVLVTMFGRKQEARSPFVQVVELDETNSDPAP